MNVRFVALLTAFLFASSIVGVCAATRTVSRQVRTLYFRYPLQRSAEFLESKPDHKRADIRRITLSNGVRSLEKRKTAIHPNGRFLYVCAGSQYVSQYRLNRASRIQALRPPAVYAASHPTAISLHPNGRFAYVTCSHGAICQYRLRHTGQLTPLSPAGVYAKTDQSPLRFDRRGRYACVTADMENGTVLLLYRVGRRGTLRFLHQISISPKIVSADTIAVRGNRVYAVIK